jgi:ketosteroid isomerase-like protein
MVSKRTAQNADVQYLGDKAQARVVAAARGDFNEALAARDILAIRSFLTENVMLVPGDEAQLIQGRDAQVEAWQGLFQSMPDVAYMRSPQRIEIGDCGTLAAETGRWRGVWSADGMQIKYNGRYFAKWRFDTADWKIEAETFVTLRRQGG